MSLIDQVGTLWRHAFWADEGLARGLLEQGQAPLHAVRELAHVLGTEETWLARIEGRSPRVAVWPDVGVDELMSLLDRTHTACRRYLQRLGEQELGRDVSYTNSAGRRFTNSAADILLHVPLHGQYHRGKINLLLRQAGLEPAPCDFIAWARGAAAATEADANRSEQGGTR